MPIRTSAGNRLAQVRRIPINKDRAFAMYRANRQWQREILDNEQKQRWERARQERVRAIFTNAIQQRFLEAMPVPEEAKPN